MDFKIAVLAGDGIGPEISTVGVDVMTAVCEKFGHKVNYEYAICGADAIDKVGDPFPEATYEACKNADAVLFSAVGDPKFDNDPTAKVRPEQGLLAMRKKLGLFANIRPVQTFKCLLHKSPLRAELVDGADFLCIRELTGGMYFGEKYQDNDKAYDTNMYTRPDYRRRGIARRVLELLTAEAEMRQIDAVMLEATAAGRPLYEAFGFKSDAVRRNYYRTATGREDAVLMTLGF